MKGCPKIWNFQIGKDQQSNFIAKSIDVKNKVDSFNTLLRVNKDRKIQTRKTYFKILGVQSQKVYRNGSNKEAEKYHQVLFKSGDMVFMGVIPEWTPIPETPFYGYLVLEMFFEPGYVKNYLMILTEN